MQKRIARAITTAIFVLVPIWCWPQGDDGLRVALLPNGTNITVTTTPFIWTNASSQVYLMICVESGNTVYGAETGTKSNVLNGVTNIVVWGGVNMTTNNAQFYLSAGGACYDSNNGNGLWRGPVTLMTTNGTANVRIAGGQR